MSETESPVYVRDRRIAALQAEPNPPLHDVSPLIETAQLSGTDEPIEDPVRVVATARAATERRLRLQSEQLKRFHQQICLRVNERVWQQREDQQSRDKRIDAKLARLLQLPDTSAASAPTTSVSPSTPLRRGPVVDSLVSAKRDQLKEFPTTRSLVESALRRDAQARDMLLASTRIARVRESRSCEAASIHDDDDDDNQANEGNGRRDDIALPVKQRVELYAAVRRQYMARGRERVHQRAKDSGDDAQRSAGRQLMSRPNKRTGEERRTDGGQVKVVDASTGCEIKLQRQSARSSTTPWRNTPSPPAPPTSASVANERFLTALQQELGTPALCSCGGRKGHVQCANNCEFYRQPKRKERAATSVCKQHS